jgi:hypothetical protein
LECDAHEPPVVMLFGRVYAADAVVGPAKFHGWGMVSVRGIGAVQALFLIPWGMTMRTGVGWLSALEWGAGDVSWHG